jgi:prepilin-type N-terminal cleavage/methylation domain-containing protein
LVRHSGLRHSSFGANRAFTLIEVIVVLVLTALLTTAVAVALTSPARAARARDAAERIDSFDRLVREHAKRAGAAQAIVFDLNRGTVRRGETESEDGIREPGSILQLPGQFRVERLLLPGGPVLSGEVRVPVSPRGQTPSYAVLLVERKQKPHWLVFAGLTGQMTEARDATEVEQLFAALGGAGSAQRDDAR